MAKQYYRNLFRNPAVIAVFAVLAAYSAIPYFYRDFLRFTCLPVDCGVKIPLFDANYWTFFSDSSATFMTIPLFAAYLLSNQAFFQKESVIVRFPSKYAYWINRIAFLLADAAIFTAFLYVLLTARMAFFSVRGLSENMVGLLLCFPLNITGFFAFGLIYQFVFTLTHRSPAAFFSAYAFVVYDYFADHLGWPGTYVVAAFSVWPDRHLTLLLNLCGMVFALTLLILLTVGLFVKRDCLIPRENKDAV